MSRKDLKKLRDNILAYGELEYFLGLYIGKFKIFYDLCGEVDDFNNAIRIREELIKRLANNFTKELCSSLSKYIETMFICLVHYVNKKNNKYGINTK